MLVVNFDLGTLNDPGAKIHSPRKAPLARRFQLMLAREAYGESGVVAEGPVLLAAKAAGGTTLVTTWGNLAPDGCGRSDDQHVHLHGTAGCVGGWQGPLNNTGPDRGHVIMGFRCCDISPFSLQYQRNGAWARHAANATTIQGSTVSLRTNGSAIVGLRYAWEGYPNCGLYNAPGGPVAGAANPKGGVDERCMRKPLPNESWTGVPPDCVYTGDALPAAPVHVSVPFGP